MSKLPVALWLENQSELDFGKSIPLWAEQLSDAHGTQKIRVIAHRETAYAKAGLGCYVLEGALWMENQVLEQIGQCLAQAREVNAKKVIVMLPKRASSELWVQFFLRELDFANAEFDEVVTLMQLDSNWENLGVGSEVDKLLLADRVMSFGGDERKVEFAQAMRALNPLSWWIHNGFEKEEDVLEAIREYAPEAPMWRETLKKEDLLAWGAKKVVYFSFTQPLDAEKLRITLDKWRTKYGASLVRLLAVVRLQGRDSPLCVQALQYLWADEFVEKWLNGIEPQTRMWIFGHGLPWDELELDIQQCVAEKAPV